MSRSVLTLLAVLSAVVLLPATAQAYVGPGAGLSAIGSLLALLAAVVVAIFGFLWFPIKSYRRKRRRAAEAAQLAEAGGTVSQKDPNAGS